MTQPILRVVPQRAVCDCGVSVLATLLGVTYEEALVALSHEEPAVLYSGVYTDDLLRAAKALGSALKKRKKYDLDEVTGILSVSSAKWSNDHVVVVFDGKLLETDGTIWDVDVFLKHHEAKPGLLLVEA